MNLYRCVDCSFTLEADDTMSVELMIRHLREHDSERDDRACGGCSEVLRLCDLWGDGVSPEASAMADEIRAAVTTKRGSHSGR